MAWRRFVELVHFVVCEAGLQHFSASLIRLAVEYRKAEGVLRTRRLKDWKRRIIQCTMDFHGKPIITTSQLLKLVRGRLLRLMGEGSFAFQRLQVCYGERLLLRATEAEDRQNDQDEEKNTVHFYPGSSGE